MLDTKYILNSNAVIEDFDNESLIFLPIYRRSIKINLITRDILNRLDGLNSGLDIVHKMSSSYEIAIDILSRDVANILTDLAEQNVIKDVKRVQLIKDIVKMEDTRYSINRDISCRIEEPEGAILFNPETEAVHVINPIGLTIWEALEYPRKKKEVIECILDEYEDVPIEQVSKDVSEFIDKLITAGFIGKVIE